MSRAAAHRASVTGRTRAALICALFASGFSVAAGEAVARGDEDYEATTARALEREASGDPAGARQILGLLRAQYPEDYATAVRLGWVEHRDGRYAEAEQAFRSAMRLTGSGVDARLGLGWALVGERRCIEALEVFRDLLAAAPRLEAARDGVDACGGRRVLITPSLGTTGGAYAVGSKSWGLGGNLGLRLLIEGRFLVGATYRYTSITPTSASGLPAFAQHEAYLDLGYGTGRWGAQATYAFVSDESKATGNSHHVGLSLRYSPFGDGVLNLSGSVYSDMTVLRAEPTWRLPIWRGLSARVGGSVEVVSGEILPTGIAGLSFFRRGFGVWAGVKYGEEVRPAMLSSAVVMNLPERVEWGTWAGAQFTARGWNFGISGEFDQLKVTSTGATGGAEFLSLFLNTSF